MCTPSVRFSVVAQQRLFASLGPTELAEIDRRCRAQWFDAGEAVYHDGAPADRIFFVAVGLVKLSHATADGRDIVSGLCGRGDFLGALPALGQEAYAESAWAMTSVCLLRLGAKDFAAILERYPSVALAALKGVSHNLTQAQSAVHLLSGAVPLERRLAATLVWLADKVGEPWDGATLLQMPLTRDDLAAIAGATPESVSRLLGSWRRAGLISSGRRWIALRDIPALVALRDGAT